MTPAIELGTPVLKLNNVGVNHHIRMGYLKKKNFWALRSVSFDLLRGETLGVVGPNGAGKSTLMKLLAGIYRPDEGDLTNLGATASLLSLRLGFLPKLTGRENVYLSAMLLGLSKKEVTAQIDSIIEFAEMEEFIDQKITTYSTGMLARLGFATAFQVNPDILLIDEVWAVGDLHFKEKSAAKMREMVHSNKTVVLASHNLELIERVCHRAIWVDKGTIRKLGAPADVVSAYKESVAKPG